MKAHHPPYTMPTCDADHCITCSDEGVPMRVESLADGGLVRCVDERGEHIDVMTALVGDVRVGDALLVHAGTALTRLTAGGQP